MSLEVRAASVKLNGKPVLHTVSLALAPGSFTALVGPNGAGKSTLLSLLSADRVPDSGEVTLENVPLNRWRADQRAVRIAMLPQSSSLRFDFTVIEVVMMGRTPHRPESAGLAQALCERALEMTGTTHLMRRRYLQLSGGEQQRVHLARVLAQLLRADGRWSGFLLLDEPTSNLDWQHQEKVLSAVREFTRGGGGALVSVHDLNLAARHADRMALMHRGQLIAAAAPKDILQPQLLEPVFELPLSVAAFHGAHQLVIRRT